MAGLARRAARTVPVAWALFLVLAVTAIAWGGTSRRLAEANEARRVGRVRQALEGYREVLAELGDRTLPGRTFQKGRPFLHGRGHGAPLPPKAHV